MSAKDPARQFTDLLIQTAGGKKKKKKYIEDTLNFS